MSVEGAAIEALQRSKPGVPKRARNWWVVHQWVGLKLSLFLTFILFTGTLAVVSHEIDWLLQPSLRVAPASVEGPVDWAAIARNAARHEAIGKTVAIEAPLASAFAARVRIERPDGTLAYLHAHPTTGQIQGVGPWVGAARILRNMHRHLNLPTWLGVPIVSSLAFVLLVSLVSSFMVYKKWWRGFAKPLRKRDARTWWGDFHRLAGVWSLWFVALIILTSVWYFAESLGLDAPRAPRVEAATSVEGSDAHAPEVADLAAALTATREAYPGLRIQQLLFPREASPYLELQGDHEALLVRPRANAVWIDPTSSQVLLTTDGRDMGLHQRIGEMADPLHFGNFGGYWTKVPWFLFGLAMTGLAVSGAAIYSLRIARERGSDIRLSRSFAGMWRGMGHWRWISLGLIAVGFALLVPLVQQAP
ncbi:PepSY domain-containing protein [Erythrobacter sp. QSSC1-22B]|uniref:PepSY-associated TM helix domain-containing protein n=1 Tax=Erythrobacter sp. QSSC1-22B TaxID=1860125 RepID=UPI000AF2F691|nr:PepSY-associated TM helix domain-containing protein [Erythrobacter sp. QSSC1-22B]